MASNVKEQIQSVRTGLPFIFDATKLDVWRVYMVGLALRVQLGVYVAPVVHEHGWPRLSGEK